MSANARFLGLYILDADREPVRCLDALTWAQWMEESARTFSTRVAFSDVGRLEVSTVFLGLDHRHGGRVPILFETMVFDQERNALDQTRYATRKEALAGHREMVEKWRKVATIG